MLATCRIGYADEMMHPLRGVVSCQNKMSVPSRDESHLFYVPVKCVLVAVFSGTSRMVLMSILTFLSRRSISVPLLCTRD